MKFFLFVCLGVWGIQPFSLYAQTSDEECKKHALACIKRSQFAQADSAAVCWLRTCDNRRDSLEAFVKLGHAHYRKRGDSTHNSFAHLYLDAAIALNLQDEKYTAQAFQRKAWLWKYKDFDKTIYYINQAITIFQSLKEERHYMACVKTLGEVASQYGDYDRAISYFKKALAFYVKELRLHYSPKTAGIVAARYADLCITYRSKGAYQEAIIYGDSAIKVASQLPVAYKARTEVLTAALIFQAEALNYAKAYQQGLSNCREVFNLIATNQDGIDLHRLYRVTAESAEGLGDFPSAALHYRKGCIIETPAGRESSKLQFAFGLFWLKQELPDSALVYFDQALKVVMQKKVDNRSENLLFRISNAKAEALFALYLRSDSLAFLMQSYELYQFMRSAEKNYLDKLTYESSLLEEVKRSHGRREGMIRTAFHLSKVNDAFKQGCIASAWQSAEGRKAVALSANLRKINHANAFLPDSMLDEMTNLRKPLDAQGKVRLAELEEELYRLFPAYHKAIKSKTPLSLQVVQQKLSTDQAIIEYFYGKEQVYAFFLTSNQAEIIELNADTLTALMEAFLAQILANKNIHSGLLFTLNQQLLAPFAPLPSRLIIIPDGPLHYLPFETLLVSPPDSAVAAQIDGRFWKGQQVNGGADYLLYHHQVQYAHSATLLFLAGKKESQGNGMAIFAPSYTATDSFGGSPILQLPRNAAHANRLAEMMDGEAYTGIQADSTTFVQHAAQYDLLHLALHGYADVENPLLAALAFSSADGSNGIVNAATLYGLPPMQAELVSLLSCETGAGQYAQGEGIMSLARAFRYGGANSVLMSLWRAETGPGVVLMESFYQNLDDGMDKSSALQQAKLAWVNQAEGTGTHPTNWANFVLIGQADPIAERPSRWPYVVGGFLLLAALLLWRRKRRK